MNLIREKLLQIKKCPGMYLGEKKLTSLIYYIYGYKERLREESNENDLLFWDELEMFIRRKYRSGMAINALVSILSIEKDEEKAFDKFYELLEEFISKYPTGIVNDISIRYEYFLNTLNEFGLHLLKESKDNITYIIFEDFYSDAITFLHESNLKILLEGNLITSEIYKLSLMLRTKFMLLYDSNAYNVESIAHNKEWKELMMLSDKIKNLIYNI